MDISVSELQRIVGGQLRLGQMPPRAGELTAVGNLVTDSREVRPGDVFWGLLGEQHDGSHFADEALARGASGVVTAGRWVAPWAGGWSLEVDDSIAALRRLADWNSQRFTGRMITIDGALGKSAAGAMIDAVLNVSHVGRAAITANGKRSIGATALALAALPSHGDYAIVEVREDLAELVAHVGRLSRPDIAVFTHSGDKSVATFSATPFQTALTRRLQSIAESDAAIVVNGDDVRLRRTAAETENSTFVGRGADNHISASDVRCAGGFLRFTVNGYRFAVRAWGRHHLTSALAAIAVGRLFGLTDGEIAEGLQACEQVERPCAVVPAGQFTIIDDTGHVQPAAMQAAMELLAESDHRGQRVMVCGDIDTVENDGDLPRSLGEQMVTRAGADLLVACGHHAAAIVAGATAAGLPLSRAVVCETADEACEALESQLRPRDVVLLSGRNLSAVRTSLERPRGLQRRAA